MRDTIMGCSYCCVSMSLILIIGSSITFGIERHKENYYIENRCLVIDAQVYEETCPENDPYTTKIQSFDSKNMTTSYYSCYQPVWTVTYNRLTIAKLSNSKTTAHIEGFFSKKYENALDDLKKYQNGSTYTCYHDKRLSENVVQWTKPNSTPGLIVLLVGIGVTILSIIGIILGKRT